MGRSPLFPAVRRLLRWQAWMMIAAAGVAYFLGGETAARSALLGGLVAFLPNAYFASRIGAAQHHKTAHEIVRSFYFGETVKLVATAALFALVLHVPGVSFGPLLGAFIAVLMVFWFALLLNDNPK